MLGKLLVFAAGAAAGVIGKMVYDESQTSTSSCPVDWVRDTFSSKGDGGGLVTESPNVNPEESDSPLQSEGCGAVHA